MPRPIGGSNANPAPRGCASAASPLLNQGCASDASPSVPDHDLRQGCAIDASPAHGTSSEGCAIEASPSVPPGVFYSSAAALHGISRRIADFEARLSQERAFPALTGSNLSYLRRTLAGLYKARADLTRTQQT